MKSKDQKKHKPLYTIDNLREMTSSFDIRSVLKHNAYQNKPLCFEEAYQLGVYALFPLKRELSDLFQNENKANDNSERNLKREAIARKSLAAICAFHNRAMYSSPGAAEQIAGICAAVFDYDIGLSTKGFLEPSVQFAVDNCGMGGDIRVTPNVSTVAALISAASGIPMCKHGSPSNADAGRHGSSDFVANIALGLNSFSDLISIPREKIEKAIEQFNFGYTEACDTGYKTIHWQTHTYANIPHMNDIIGPITNPLISTKATKKIIGINQLIDPKVVAEAYQILNERGITAVQDGLFIRGFVFNDRRGPDNDDGMDELSTMAGGTRIVRLRKDKIEEYDLYASDFGLPEAKYEDIKPVGGKGEFSYKILKNEIRGPARDMILANAALIEHLVNGTDHKAAYQKMRDVLDSGLPFENLQRIKEFLRGNQKI